jgi:hypothetical protein
LSAGTRLALGVAAVLVLAGGVVGGILYLRDEDPPADYDARIEDDFMATCTADAEQQGFAHAQDFCRCAFDRIRTVIPFDRFLAIDETLQDDPGAVPGRVDRIRTACYLEVESAGPASSSVPSTTAAPA